MSVENYYLVLGISPNAGFAEIKAAYRQLAKKYHPDYNPGNPEANEKFRRIKEAYETLISPAKKNNYDLKLRNQNFKQQSNSASEKTPRQEKMNEEKAKVYQSYYQNYQKQKKSSTAEFSTRGEWNSKEKKSPYKDNKAILLSFPLTVALLLFIIHIYELPRPVKPPESTVPNSTVLKPEMKLHTGDSPYLSHFGFNVYDTLTDEVIRIENKTGQDAILFVRNDSDIVRNYAICTNYEIFLEHLPSDCLTVYYWMGSHFTNHIFLFDTVLGGFQKTFSLDSFPHKIKPKKNRFDTVSFALPAVALPTDSNLLHKILFYYHYGRRQNIRLPKAPSR